jgi:predicted RNase H-like HicB family nuclease
MKRHFPVIIEQDKDGVFIVDCPALQGCRSYGRTVEEAVENIREAIAVCLDETTLRRGKPCLWAFGTWRWPCRDRYPLGIFPCAHQKNQTTGI